MGRWGGQPGGRSALINKKRKSTSFDDLLSTTDHRPWLLPHGPWVMTQTWEDLLFAHWPVPARELAPFVPAPLELDLCDGVAWVGVVPFRMSGVRPRGGIATPYLSAFPELNVRTYVLHGGKPGVLFLSLDAGNPVAVELGRRWYHLPYFRARMSCREESGRIEYNSRRTHPGAPRAEFRARYSPTGPVAPAAPASLANWLTERYALYAPRPNASIYRADIHHRPWPLQPAEAEFEMNTMAASHGVHLSEAAPLLHFARRLEVLAWRPERM
ncbi:MAG: DUF2071 domain-containing protein [Chloroflexia bacterium]